MCICVQEEGKSIHRLSDCSVLEVYFVMAHRDFSLFISDLVD